MIGALIFKGLIFAAIVMSFQPTPKPTFKVTSLLKQMIVGLIILKQ
jgi:hypothetical protein